MPLPISSVASTDAVFYRVLERLMPGQQGCWLHPNVITAANLLIVMMILRNLLNGGTVRAALLLAFIGRILDLMDGAQARRCNLKSRTGELFDLGVDTLCHSGISLVSLLWLASPSSEWGGWMSALLAIGPVIGIVFPAIWWGAALAGDTSRLPSWVEALHDNSVVLGTVAVGFAKLILSR